MLVNKIFKLFDDYLTNTGSEPIMVLLFLILVALTVCLTDRSLTSFHPYCQTRALIIFALVFFFLNNFLIANNRQLVYIISE